MQEIIKFVRVYGSSKIYDSICFDDEFIKDLDRVINYF